MMLHKNRKVTVCIADGDTGFFDIVAEVMQGDSLEPYIHIYQPLRSGRIWHQVNFLSGV